MKKYIFYKEIDKMTMSIYKLIINTDDMEKIQKILAIYKSLKEL